MQAGHERHCRLVAPKSALLPPRREVVDELLARQLPGAGEAARAAVPIASTEDRTMQPNESSEPSTQVTWSGKVMEPDYSHHTTKVQPGAAWCLLEEAADDNVKVAASGIQ